VGQHRQARAARDLAAERLRDTTLRAPVGGIVTRAAVDRGQMVAPGVPAFQVQDVSAYEVDVGFDEANAYAVVPGQAVRVRVLARADLTLDGRIQTVSSSLDRQTRKALATIRLDSTAERLITGSTVMVELALDPRTGVVTVPETAVVDRDGSPVVRVVESGNVVRNVPVRTGLRQDGEVEVDAVGAGSTVVVTGPPELVDGTVVEPRS
jgi:RND family efflux transporter MFP subunit